MRKQKTTSLYKTTRTIYLYFATADKCYPEGGGPLWPIKAEYLNYNIIEVTIVENVSNQVFLRHQILQ
jgi:hypothetical protein